ncbi:hypothetical protein Q0Z83_062090 [Actinoplanes sichuanensis]|nr:hypothetical protein Q0Z83_062090 [Actinoplanes sichuanensis]
MLGEESGRTGDGDRVWLVDPLCGTLNHAVDNMPASVNAALRVDDRVTVAASDAGSRVSRSGAGRAGGGGRARLRPG